MLTHFAMTLELRSIHWKSLCCFFIYIIVNGTPQRYYGRYMCGNGANSDLMTSWRIQIKWVTTRSSQMIDVKKKKKLDSIICTTTPINKTCKISIRIRPQRKPLCSVFTCQQTYPSLTEEYTGYYSECWNNIDMLRSHHCSENPIYYFFLRNSSFQDTQHSITYMPYGQEVHNVE